MFCKPNDVSVLQALAPLEAKLNPTSHTHYQTRSALAAGPEYHASPDASRSQAKPNILASDMPDERLAERRHKYFRGLLLRGEPVDFPLLPFSFFGCPFSRFFGNCTHWAQRHLDRRPNFHFVRSPRGPTPHTRAPDSPTSFPPPRAAFPALLAMAVRMSALQNLPQSWRRALFLLQVLIVTLLLLPTGLYNGAIPKPTM